MAYGVKRAILVSNHNSLGQFERVCVCPYRKYNMRASKIVPDDVLPLRSTIKMIRNIEPSSDSMKAACNRTKASNYF